MNPKRKQRLVIVIGVLCAIGIATGLAMYAMRDNLNYFYTPTQVVNGDAPMNQNIRVGGLVVKGSLVRGKDLSVSFDITDEIKTIKVKFNGILPDLFREGQGIIATGRVTGSDVVQAQEVLAKHDEKYMPPEVKQELAKAGHPVKSTP